MKILALDLSLSATGFALPNGTLGTIAPRHLTGVERLDWIDDQVIRLVVDVDLVVIEGYAYGRPNQAVHIGELGGVIRLSLYQRGFPVAEVPPASVKKYATGKGNATKPDMRVALLQRAGIDERDDNRVDAWWLRAAALDHYGAPIVAMPAANRDGLAKVAWPELEAAS